MQRVQGQAVLPYHGEGAAQTRVRVSSASLSCGSIRGLLSPYCSVSLLTDFELCESYLDWTLNTHGIYISLPNPALTPPSSTPSSSSSSSSLPLSSSTPRATYRSISHLPAFVPAAYPNPRRLPTVLSATYLPDVPGAQGWTKIEAVDSAIRKAGWSGRITEETRGSMRVTRYQSKKVEVRYEEIGRAHV